MNPRSLLLLAALALAAGCSNDDAAGNSPPAPARQYVLLLDLSGSQTAAKREAAQHAVSEMLARLGPGDRVVLMQVHQGSASEDGAVRWTDTVPHMLGAEPTTLDRERAERVRRAARSVADNIFAQGTAGRLPTTDLFSSLHVAGEYVRDAGGRRSTLVLLSDMLQSANGVDMERAGGVPSAAWITQQQGAGLLPRLRGACVAVIGADATSPAGVRVRRFWQAYFSAAGARLADDDYRLIATGGAAPACL